MILRADSVRHHPARRIASTFSSARRVCASIPSGSSFVTGSRGALAGGEHKPGRGDPLAVPGDRLRRVLRRKTRAYSGLPPLGPRGAVWRRGRIAARRADRGGTACRGRRAARGHLRLRARAGRDADAPPVRLFPPVRRHRQPADLAGDADAGGVAATRRDRPAARGAPRGRRGPRPVDRFADARHGRRTRVATRPSASWSPWPPGARAIGAASVVASGPRAARCRRFRGRAARHDDVLDRDPAGTVS